jgi:hypothetical protein
MGQMEMEIQGRLISTSLPREAALEEMGMVECRPLRFLSTRILLWGSLARR